MVTMVDHLFFTTWCGREVPFALPPCRFTPWLLLVPPASLPLKRQHLGGDGSSCNTWRSDMVSCQRSQPNAHTVHLDLNIEAILSIYTSCRHRFQASIHIQFESCDQLNKSMIFGWITILEQPELQADMEITGAPYPFFPQQSVRFWRATCNFDMGIYPSIRCRPSELTWESLVSLEIQIGGNHPGCLPSCSLMT